VGRAANFYLSLGPDLLDRYKRTSNPQDLQNAVDAFRRAISLSRKRSRDKCIAQFFLCIALRQVYDRTRDPAALREGVEAGNSAAREMEPDPTIYATGLLNLAIGLRNLGELTQDLTHIDTAIGYGRWGAGLAPDNPLRLDALLDLSRALYARFRVTGELADLREAISVGWQTLDLIPGNHSERTAAPYRLAEYLGALYTKTQDPADLDNAIIIARRGAQVSYDDPHYGDHLRQLGNLLRDVYRDRGLPDALNEAIHHLRTAAAHPPREPRNAAMVLMSLGCALESLSSRTKDPEVAGEAVQWLRQARSASAGDSFMAATVDSNLVTALGTLYQQTHRGDVLAEATRLGRQVLAQTPETDPHRGQRAGQLGLLLGNLADEPGGDAAVEDEGISLLREAASTVAGPALQAYRFALWRALRIRYNRYGGLPVLHEAISAIDGVLQTADPADELYSEYQYSHGTSLLALHLRTGDSQTLWDALRTLRLAVAAGPPGDPVRSQQRRASLAVGLVAAFQLAHTEATLDEAITLLIDVIAAQGDAAEVVHMSNLMHALLVRFDDTGRLADLDQAIEVGRRGAAAAAPEEEPTVLSNLACALRELVNWTGQHSAADEARLLLQGAADRVGPTHPNAPAVFSNASLILGDLAERLDRADWNDEALGYARRAVQAAPPGHYARPAALNNLGEALTGRASGSAGARGIDDLREAIAVLTEAAGSATGDAKAIALHNLAMATGRLGSLNGDEALIRDAVRLYRQALDHASSPARRAQTAAELGTQLLELMAQSGDATLQDEILEAYGQTVSVPDAPPSLRLKAARVRAGILAEAGRWREALPDYTLAISLIGQVAAHHLTAADKRDALRMIRALGVDAAACALNADEPERALELAEHARGVMIGEAFDAHVDLSELRARAPQTARRFEALRNELDTAPVASSPVATLGSDLDAQAFTVESRFRLGQRWNNLLSEIRGLSGFETFLLPPTADSLASAASAGPVVLLNASQFRCDALILSHGAEGHPQLQVVNLPRLDIRVAADQADTILSAFNGTGAATFDEVNAAARAALGWLWTTVVQPVLSRMELGQAGRGAPLPRIWWCPTSFLSYLPLHAAELRGSAGEQLDSALDHVVSSYTPSIRALLERPADTGPEASAADRVVVVAMPTTPGGQADLDAVEDETAEIKAVYPEAQVLEGPGARSDTVLQALQEHSIAHFACHAVSDEQDPLASRLLLFDHEDSPLTVGRLLQVKATAPRLAFLSACSTAQTSRDLMDEALNIVSAFRVAGFRQVVGTLWPVEDKAAALVVKDFYACYRAAEDDWSAGTAAYALHEATRKARERYLDQPLFWMAHVHAGR